MARSTRRTVFRVRFVRSPSSTLHAAIDAAIDQPNGRTGTVSAASSRSRWPVPAPSLLLFPSPNPAPLSLEGALVATHDDDRASMQRPVASSGGPRGCAAAGPVPTPRAPYAPDDWWWRWQWCWRCAVCAQLATAAAAAAPATASTTAAASATPPVDSGSDDDEPEFELTDAFKAFLRRNAERRRRGIVVRVHVVAVAAIFPSLPSPAAPPPLQQQAVSVVGRSRRMMRPVVGVIGACCCCLFSHRHVADAGPGSLSAAPFRRPRSPLTAAHSDRDCRARRGWSRGPFAGGQKRQPYGSIPAMIPSAP